MEFFLKSYVHKCTSLLKWTKSEPLEWFRFCSCAANDLNILSSFQIGDPIIFFLVLARSIFFVGRGLCTYASIDVIAANTVDLGLLILDSLRTSNMFASWTFVGAKTLVDNNATSEVSLTLMLCFCMHLVTVQFLLQRPYLLSLVLLTQLLIIFWIWLWFFAKFLSNPY